jgi:hypothetical protein
VDLRPLACWHCGFESRRGHDCLLLRASCFVRQRCLRRADHSSRRVLPTLAHRAVWSINLKYEVSMGPALGCGTTEEIIEYMILIILVIIIIIIIDTK